VPKKGGAFIFKCIKNANAHFWLISTVTSSKITTQSTTVKPGKGKLSVNATTTAPKKEGGKI
jgi:hypothetical protein